MDLGVSFDEIKPFLSERGALEVELAAQRAVIARLVAAPPQVEESADG